MSENMINTTAWFLKQLDEWSVNGTFDGNILVNGRSFRRRTAPKRLEANEDDVDQSLQH